MIAEKCIDRSYVFSVGGYQIPACPPWQDLQKSSKTLEENFLKKSLKEKKISEIKSLKKSLKEKSPEENLSKKISRRKSLEENLSKKISQRKSLETKSFENRDFCLVVPACGALYEDLCETLFPLVLFDSHLSESRVIQN